MSAHKYRNKTTRPKLDGYGIPLRGGSKFVQQVKESFKANQEKRGMNATCHPKAREYYRCVSCGCCVNVGQEKKPCPQCGLKPSGTLMPWQKRVAYNVKNL